MSEEGRFSRAIEKAGAGHRLAANDNKPTSESVSQEPTGLASPATGAQSFERVRGKCQAPALNLVMVHDRTGEAASQIRAVRARILAMNGGEPPRVITISSSARQEGKTTLALNLAAALSEVDSARALVVDGDALAPGLHLLANVQAETGLNEVLENGLDLNDNVYETEIPGVDVIPARASAAARDHESLLARHCGQLLAKLRKLYSYVIIDTPPVLASGEACTFGKHSDGVILIARLEKTPRDVVKRAAQELAHCGARVIGCVLTDRKHHVPDFIYSFFGTPPSHYYNYSRSRTTGPKDEAPTRSGDEDNGS